MANSFARAGYKNALGQFEGVNFRAMDVFTANGISAEVHIGDAVIHLTSEQVTRIANAIQASEKGLANGVAPLGADGLVPQQYIHQITLADVTQTADDIAALTALNVTVAPLRTVVLVEDASGDSTVTSGWAMYFRVGTAGGTLDDWLKLTEGESLDIDFSDLLTLEDLPEATLTAKGIVQLSSAVDSASETLAATPNAVKQAYDQASMLDAAYVTDDADMASKNLRTGAIVLMAVDNEI